MNRDRWVLGDAGQQAAIGQQYDALAGDLLNIYSNDFVTTWRTALGNLRLKKLLADKPKYDALRALSAPTSPLRQILESIRDETALTKERPKPANAAAPADALRAAVAGAVQHAGRFARRRRSKRSSNPFIRCWRETAPAGRSIPSSPT